jgi:hypothetical protein
MCIHNIYDSKCRVSLAEISDVGKTSAYDLLNTTIARENPAEESDLPIAGRKNRLFPEIFMEYFTSQGLGPGVQGY